MSRNRTISTPDGAGREPRHFSRLHGWPASVLADFAPDWTSICGHHLNSIPAEAFVRFPACGDEESTLYLPRLSHTMQIVALCRPYHPINSLEICQIRTKGCSYEEHNNLQTCVRACLEGVGTWGRTKRLLRTCQASVFLSPPSSHSTSRSDLSIDVAEFSPKRHEITPNCHE